MGTLELIEYKYHQQVYTDEPEHYSTV